MHIEGWHREIVSNNRLHPHAVTTSRELRNHVSRGSRPGRTASSASPCVWSGRNCNSCSASRGIGSAVATSLWGQSWWDRWSQTPSPSAVPRLFRGSGCVVFFFNDRHLVVRTPCSRTSLLRRRSIDTRPLALYRWSCPTVVCRRSKVRPPVSRRSELSVPP